MIIYTYLLSVCGSRRFTGDLATAPSRPVYNDLTIDELNVGDGISNYLGIQQSDLIDYSKLDWIEILTFLATDANNVAICYDIFC